MKLIKINGKIWELSILDSEYADNDIVSLDDRNIISIKNGHWFNNIVHTLANHGVKSKAHAIIETEVNGLPSQITYDIYHNSKGFFCNVQSKRVFLIDLIKPETLRGE